MSVKPKLILFFIKLKEKNQFESFIFLGNKYLINESLESISIDIEEDLFGKRKEKKIVELILVPISRSLENIIYKFNIYYGINKGYLFLSDEKQKMLFELNFKEEKSVIIENIELKNTDYFDIDSRRRMLLINCPYLIKIKDSYNYLYEYISTELRKKNENSFNVCVFDIDKAYCAAKIIKKETNISYIVQLKKYKEALEKFYKEISELISKENEIDNIKNIIQKNYVCILDINFSKNTIELKDDFKTNDDYFLMYLYFLWFIFYVCYFQNKNYKISSLIMFKYLKKFYNIYLEDKDLLPYQKVLLFCSNTIYFVSIQDPNKYESKKLRYIKSKNIKEKSVYGLSFKFIKEFIQKLNSKSLLFYPLLLLNNGIYCYNNESVYGFDVQNSDNIKSHLYDLIPEIFFEIEDEVLDITYSEYGFNYKGYGIIFLNKSVVLKNFKNNPELFEYTNKFEEKEFKNYSVKVSKTLIHEGFGHNKYIYNSSKNIDSPLKFFNSENEIVTVVSPFSINYDNKFILKGSKPNKGESGRFLEYFFGHFENKLIISLIYELDDISKLYDSVDYFVKDNLFEIKKYIILKYKLKNKGIIYKDNDDNMNLEEENKKMEMIFNEKFTNELDNINAELFENSKSKDDLSKVYFLKYEIKGYDYYMNKVKEETDLAKKADYLWELLNYLKS